MDESRMRTSAQLQAFLAATPQVVFSAARMDESQKYEFIGWVLSRFGYTQRGRAEPGVLLAYLRCASSYKVREQVFHCHIPTSFHRISPHDNALVEPHDLLAKSLENTNS